MGLYFLVPTSPPKARGSPFPYLGSLVAELLPLLLFISSHLNQKHFQVCNSGDSKCISWLWEWPSPGCTDLFLTAASRLPDCPPETQLLTGPTFVAVSGESWAFPAGEAVSAPPTSPKVLLLPGDSQLHPHFPSSYSSALSPHQKPEFWLSEQSF